MLLKRSRLSLRNNDGQTGAVHARLLFLSLLLIFFGTGLAQAQTEVRVTVLSTAPARVRVEGTSGRATTVWAFRNSYAGVVGIGERVENLALWNAQGESVSVRKSAPGEFEAASAATRFSYEMKLDAPAQTTDAAYISWLNNERGFLMTGDLFPRDISQQPGVAVRFDLPAGWSVYSNEIRKGERQFLADGERAVFYAGRDLREKRGRAGSMEFSLFAGGDWAFTDEEVAEAARNILKEHERTAGLGAQQRVALMLSPYPRPMSAERWSAETRGATVVLLAGRQPSKIAALSQLSVPLTHELFHLWVPNALLLDGNYDWFYEGFTLYQAMRASMRLGLLTFQDYLRALGRAYDIYLQSNERDKWSLLEASERRWSGANSLVYNKGMLVAFLYDLYLREQNGGRRSLDDVYKNLFRLRKTSGARAEGNAVVLAALKEAGDGGGFVRRFVEEANAIDLGTVLAPFGLRIQPGTVRTQVVVGDSLTGRQRDLLRQLGYNDKVERERPRRK